MYTNNENDILLIFGNNVRMIRRKKNISQDELANRANLHRTYIGMIERAEKNITLKNMQKIAKALDLNTYQLIQYTDNINEYLEKKG